VTIYSASQFTTLGRVSKRQDSKPEYDAKGQVLLGAPSPDSPFPTTGMARFIAI
jgi:hypothetical protein